MDWVLYLTLYSSIVRTFGYVLLTANLDDFKDLARKIVPGRFADELTNVFLKKILNANPQSSILDDDKEARLLMKGEVMKTVESLSNQERRLNKEGVREPGRESIETNSRKSNSLHQFREKDEYSKINIEAIADKVIEVLSKKYHLNLETKTEQPKQRKATDFIQEQNKYASKRASKNTYRNFKQNTDSYLYQSNLTKTRTDRDSQFNKENASKKGSDVKSNYYPFYKPVHSKKPGDNAMNDNNRATGTRSRTTTRLELVKLYKEYVESNDFKSKLEIIQPDTKQPKFGKKKYTKLQIISEYFKNRHADTSRGVQSNKDLHEYKVEYYEDNVNDKKQIRNTAIPLKKVIIELQNGPINTKSSNDPLVDMPDQNFYLKLPADEANEPTKPALLGFLAQNPKGITKYEKPAKNKLYEVVELTNKRDTYEDYQIPKKARDIYSSNEKRKKKAFNKAEEYVNYEDHITEDIRGVSMALGQWLGDDTATKSTVKNGFIISKYTMATMFNIRSKYTISTPNYLANLPKEAEKYDFTEPLPEKDRVSERYGFRGNPEESVNHRLKLGP